MIICAHNPRPGYFRRVLDGLRAQTLPVARWELWLIDNGSREPLTGWDLSWHPQARCLREEKLGHINARARGIRESTGALLVFVDDDNVLAPDYLAEVTALFEGWPMLGAVGAGVCRGEFEVPPPESIVPYLAGLAVRELDRSYWGNLPGFSRALPFGAGLSVRREVAEDYARKIATDPLRQLLGRTGTGLGSGDDSDLGMCAHDVGLGTGRFVSLKLDHLIPKERLTEDYMIRLNAGFARSGEILHALREGGMRPREGGPPRQIRHYYNVWKRKGFERRLYVACEAAREEARRRLAEAGQGAPA